MLPYIFILYPTLNSVGLWARLIVKLSA